jgi:hypothetical protein
MNGVDKVAGLHGLVGVGGRLNVQRTLTAPTTPPVVYIPPPPAPPPAPVDTTAPTDPAVSSTSHVVGVRSIDATVDVTWSGAHDFGSGVDGYSFTWDRSGTSVPDTTKDVEETAQQLTSAPLAPGTYWFHIRARDNAGNWSAGTHAGPFVIVAAAISPQGPDRRAAAGRRTRRGQRNARRRHRLSRPTLRRKAHLTK